MTHNKRAEMGKALKCLRQAIEIETQCPGALPGRALKHIKEAIACIKKDPMMQKEAEKK